MPFDAIGQVSVSVAPFDIRQSNFQGGVIDTTLASGTNDYHVNGFYSESTSGLQGHQIGDVTVPNIHYDSKTYGATLSGPIVRDSVFFSGSYEKNTDPRPLSPGDHQPDSEPDDARCWRRSSRSPRTSMAIRPATSCRSPTTSMRSSTIKLNANITDRQKLSFSYINAYDATDSLVNSNTGTGNNTSAPTATPSGDQPRVERL